MNPRGREAGKPDFYLVLLGGANSPGWAFPSHLAANIRKRKPTFGERGAEARETLTNGLLEPSLVRGGSTAIGFSKHFGVCFRARRLSVKGRVNTLQKLVRAKITNMR